MTIAGKSFLLCAYSSKDAPSGLLKAKVKKFKELLLWGQEVTFGVVSH
jgi:hypothetical protein